MLINSPLLRYVKEESVAEQYRYLKKNVSWDRYMLDDTSVFGVHLYCMQTNTHNLVNWVNKNIVLNLGQYEYESKKTYDVLLRIATGMINKLDLPEEVKLKMHINMTHNVHNELGNIMNETLPF